MGGIGRSDQRANATRICREVDLRHKSKQAVSMGHAN